MNSRSILTIEASSLGTSFIADPEFSLPQRPRMIPELVTLAYGQNALLFDGVRDLQVISGRSARTFLPQLFPLLDGTRSLDDLAAAFPKLPPKSLTDAIVLLYSRGLLEDGGVEETDAALQPLASFAGRYCDVTRVNPSRHAVLQRLARARVAVVGNRAGRHIMTGLSGYGFAQLDVLEAPSALHVSGYDLLVACFGADDTDMTAWFDVAHAADVPALHAHAGADAVEIGPYIIPGQSGCYRCLRTLHPAPEGDAGHQEEFWAGVIALQASTLLSRLGSTKLYNACKVHRTTGQGASYEKRTLPRLPGCPHCGLESARLAPTHPDARVWIVHHSAHVMTCKALRSPRDHQVHYAASNLDLTRKRPQPRYGVPVLPLPEGDDASFMPSWTQAPPSPPTGRADRELLAQMLRYAAGYQALADGRRRLAASGGGLGSCDVFVVIRRLSGLESGVYHYFGYEHCLERIGIVEDALLCGALGVEQAALPPVVLFGTSDMGKTREKYDEFSFRIGALDGGVACQLIHELAASAGVPVAEYPELRDKVAAHFLNLPQSGNRRMLTFALGIGAIRCSGEPVDPLAHHYQSPDLLIELCARLGPARLSAAVPSEPEVAPHVAQPLDTLVRARRSHRTFAVRAVAFSAARSIAAVAMAANVCREAANALPISLSLWVICMMDGPDFPRGIYCAKDGMLVQVGAAVDRARILSTMQQHGYAEAPLTLFVTCDLERALLDHGPRGYREAVARAGSVLGKAQLCAQSWSLVGSLWGGVAEEGVGQLLGIDRYRDCPLFAASLGYAADV
ncbi:hypothetical protein [Xanthomonas sp. MUS 060]|uniref:hypothetical protein n=1 Tax=Xanthomonas sp. MUS 060 TaxID=1588031 RepID=UPI0005F2DC8F|nr:hypothetical protein [Xanthomonas sp. MUS 060]